MLLGPGDPLPALPHRILVNAGSGAGKTTLAVALGAQLGLPHTEIDEVLRERPELPVVQLQSDRDVARWRAGLGQERR